MDNNNYNNIFNNQPSGDNHNSILPIIAIVLIIIFAFTCMILRFYLNYSAKKELQDRIAELDKEIAEFDAKYPNETENGRFAERPLTSEEFAKLLEEARNQKEETGKRVDEYLENHRINADETANPADAAPALYEYDCTQSLIANDKGYGDPRAAKACPSGVARMEMEDHKASIYDAIEDCRKRGMRLPTYHELSAAGQYAHQLGLQSGNYWANERFEDVHSQNCKMPAGNCGRINSEPPQTLKQWYRCVAMD